MENTTNQNPGIRQKKSAFEYFTEVISWVQIVASPFIVGLLIGAIIYFTNPKGLTFMIAAIIATIGLIIGVIWATKVWKRKGTMHFISRIMATPEFDEKEKDKKI